MSDTNPPPEESVDQSGDHIGVILDETGIVTNVIVLPEYDADLGEAWAQVNPIRASKEEHRRGLSPGWGFDSTHPARFAPVFRDEMLEPNPETGESPPPQTVFSEGKIYDPDEANWPPSGKPAGTGWKRPTA